MKGKKQTGPATAPQRDQAKTSPANNNTATQEAKAEPVSGKGKAPPEKKAKAAGLQLPKPEPWPEPIAGASLLDDLVRAFRRYLALPDGAAEAMALWVVFTHTFDAYEVSPRLAFTSPVFRCGKTTALSILTRLVPRPLPASNITPAVVFRVIERARPTLLIDEADTFLDRDGALKGILNSGHTRDTSYVLRCEGDNHEPQCFSTWAPIAVAKIGKLPATLHDRSIVVPMRRRRSDEKVERFRQDHTGGLKELAQKAARWAKDHIEGLCNADPEIPDGLHDRAADNWRPLIAIADQAGGHWPDRARRIAELLAGEATEPARKVQLLGDIRTTFAEQCTDRITSKALCKALGKREDQPWGDLDHGYCITSRQLARLLKPFGINPRTIRIGTETPRGYRCADFEDAFARYLPPESATPQQPNEINVLGENSPATGGDDVADK